MLRAFSVLGNDLINLCKCVRNFLLNLVCEVCVFQTKLQFCASVHNCLFADFEALENLGVAHLAFNVEKVSQLSDKDAISMLLCLENVLKTVLHILVCSLLGHLLKVSLVCLYVVESLFSELEVFPGEVFYLMRPLEHQVLAKVVRLADLLVNRFEDLLFDLGQLLRRLARRVCFDHG